MNPHGMRRLFAVIALGLIIFCAGCNRTHTTKVIAVIPKANADLFWQTVHAGAVKAARERHVEIIWNGPATESDIAGEMQIVETMINRHVDAIAVAPSDKTSFKIVIERAMRAGIPVIVFDSAVGTDQYISFVATDNFAAGELAGNRMAELLHNQGNVILVSSNPGGASTVEREQGFKHALHSRAPSIEILDERFAMGSVAQSLTISENMLTAHPDVNGVFASSEPSIDGAIQAVKSRGSKAKVIGFDSSPNLLNEVQAGRIDSLVVQDPFRMGQEVIQTAVKTLNGEKVSKKIALLPRLVDAKNLNDPDVQIQLHPELNAYLN